jgi:hypothetical protein
MHFQLLTFEYWPDLFFFGVFSFMSYEGETSSLFHVAVDDENQTWSVDILWVSYLLFKMGKT